MLPKFLQPEAFPYASVTIVPAGVCACGVPDARHVDGWDGNRLDCTEARRRNGLPDLAAIATIPARVICAWCPDFDGRQSSTRGVSHGMCDACAALFDAVIDADRANGDDPIDSSRDGEACGSSCGYCGRCS